MLKCNKLRTTAIIMVVGIIILDIITKWFIDHTMLPYEVNPIINNFFNIVHVKNYGSAFSFLSDAPVWFRKPFFLIVPLAAMTFIVIVMLNSESKKLQFLGFASVMGGALGNFLNRVYLGYVIDFLDFKLTRTYHFPSFNVADIAITCGLCLVLLDMALESVKKRTNKK